MHSFHILESNTFNSNEVILQQESFFFCFNFLQIERQCHHAVGFNLTCLMWAINFHVTVSRSQAGCAPERSSEVFPCDTW